MFLSYIFTVHPGHIVAKPLPSIVGINSDLSFADSIFAIDRCILSPNLALLSIASALGDNPILSNLMLFFHSIFVNGSLSVVFIVISQRSASKVVVMLFPTAAPRMAGQTVIVLSLISVELAAMTSIYSGFNSLNRFTISAIFTFSTPTGFVGGADGALSLMRILANGFPAASLTLNPSFSDSGIPVLTFISLGVREAGSILLSTLYVVLQ